MAGRRSIKFTDEQNEYLIKLIKDDITLDEIVSKLNSEFNANYSRSTVYKQLKLIGGVITDKRGDTKVEIDEKTLLRKLSEYKTNEEIANELGVTTNVVRKNIKRKKINWDKVREFKDSEYFAVEEIDLTTLRTDAKDRIYDEMKKLYDGEIARDVVIVCKGVSVKVDYYFPEIDTAYTCSVIYGDDITKDANERVDQIQVSKWVKYINKDIKREVTVIQRPLRKGERNVWEHPMVYMGENHIGKFKMTHTTSALEVEYGDGFKIMTYAVEFDFENKVYDFVKTSNKIIGEVKSLLSNNTVRRDRDFEDPHFKEIDDYTTTVRVKEYIPSQVEIFDDYIKEYRKKDEANYKREMKEKTQRHPKLGCKDRG